MKRNGGENQPKKSTWNGNVGESQKSEIDNRRKIMAWENRKMAKAMQSKKANAEENG
jgi:hypothetical protein